MSKVVRQLTEDPSLDLETLLITSKWTGDEAYKIKLSDITSRDIYLEKEMNLVVGVGTITAQSVSSNEMTLSDSVDYQALNVGTILVCPSIFTWTNNSAIVLKVTGSKVRISSVVPQHLTGESFSYSLCPLAITDADDTSLPVYGSKFMVTENGIRCDNIAPIGGNPNIDPAIAFKTINTGVDIVSPGPGVATFPTLPAGRIYDGLFNKVVSPSTWLPVFEDGAFYTDYWQSFESIYDETTGVTLNPEISGLYKLRVVLTLGDSAIPIDTSGKVILRFRVNGSTMLRWQRIFIRSLGIENGITEFIHEITMPFDGGDTIKAEFWHDYTGTIYQNPDPFADNPSNTCFEIKFVG